MRRARYGQEGSRTPVQRALFGEAAEDLPPPDLGVAGCEVVTGLELRIFPLNEQARSTSEA